MALLRLSIGLEDADTLLKSLKRLLIEYGLRHIRY